MKVALKQSGFLLQGRRDSTVAEGPRDALSVETLSTVTYLYKKSHLKGLLQANDYQGQSVIGNDSIR